MLKFIFPLSKLFYNTNLSYPQSTALIQKDVRFSVNDPILHCLSELAAVGENKPITE